MGQVFARQPFLCLLVRSIFLSRLFIWPSSRRCIMVIALSRLVQVSDVLMMEIMHPALGISNGRAIAANTKHLSVPLMFSVLKSNMITILVSWWCGLAIFLFCTAIGKRFTVQGASRTSNYFFSAHQYMLTMTVPAIDRDPSRSGWRVRFFEK